jgi:hypothetical protein
VPIYDGTQFILRDTGGTLSQATTDTTKSPAAVAASKNYDMFVWNDSGTIRCTRGPTWDSGTAGSDTVRGTGAGSTELERINGIWVNKIAITNGPAAQRGTYVGTIRSDASSQINYRLYASGTTADAAAHIGVWNMYNRVRVELLSRITTASWTYNSATWRARNGTTTAWVNIVSGMAEDAIFAMRAGVALTAATASNNRAYLGIGLDSTSTVGVGVGPTQAGNAITTPHSCMTQYDPQLGYHYIAPLERAESTNTVTLYNDGPQFTVGWMA